MIVAYYNFRMKPNFYPSVAWGIWFLSWKGMMQNLLLFVGLLLLRVTICTSFPPWHVLAFWGQKIRLRFASWKIVHSSDAKQLLQQDWRTCWILPRRGSVSTFRYQFTSLLHVLASMCAPAKVNNEHRTPQFEPSFLQQRRPFSHIESRDSYRLR